MIDTLPISLPEDLAPLPHAQRHVSPVAAVLARSISLSPAAHQMIGSPARVDVLFGSKSRMVGIRPNPDGKLAVRYDGGPNCFAAITIEGAARRFGLKPQGRRYQHQRWPRYTPRLAESGVLLFGPLPEVPS